MYVWVPQFTHCLFNSAYPCTFLCMYRACTATKNKGRCMCTITHKWKLHLLTAGKKEGTTMSNRMNNHVKKVYDFSSLQFVPYHCMYNLQTNLASLTWSAASLQAAVGQPSLLFPLTINVHAYHILISLPALLFPSAFSVICASCSLYKVFCAWR